MTAPHDLDRQLDAFLRDGPTELPDPSFDAVRDRMETTRQRVVIGPWRIPDMNKFVPSPSARPPWSWPSSVGIQFAPTGGAERAGRRPVGPAAGNAPRRRRVPPRALRLPRPPRR